MKKLCMLMAALAVAAPASAITYSFDYLIGTSNPDGRFVDFSDGSRGTGDLRVLGQVSTDGTIGQQIDENNILSWSFTLSAASESLFISSAGGLGDGGTGNNLVSDGVFFATAQSLTPAGGFRFAEFDTIYRLDGSPEQVINGDLRYLDTGSGQNRVEFQTRLCGINDRDCFAPVERFGFGALDQGPAPVGLADVSTIPLPASAFFLIAALGSAAMFRRRAWNSC